MKSRRAGARAQERPRLCFFVVVVIDEVHVRPVNILSFAGSRMSVLASGGCPGLRTGVDLAIGLKCGNMTSPEPAQAALYCAENR